MIFYLSCTGNTRWAAEYIAKHTGDKAISITDIADNCSFTLAHQERIGFCFPVHGWRPSILFRRFAANLKISGYHGNYCYALCTAGDNIGETMDIFEKDISALGLKLHSACSLIMPESYLGLPFFKLDSEEKEAVKIENASEKLKAFADIVEERREGFFELDCGRWKRINSRLLGYVFTNKLLDDKLFRVDADKCIACGKCSGVCPVGNISYDGAGRPQWHHDGSCITCFSCYHYCPARAIDYGSRTKGKGQYHFKEKHSK